ncbi:MAG: VTT domain-containing protein [Salinivirgaceae bacterium]|jgi:membrane protein YqaA with SNARE-associated domain|nr:VTT domain-containing protein [Salinivirgaceae bacterium]
MFELGYWGLFLASFLAATVVPFSSEAILSAMIYADFNTSACLVAASLGNWLGGLSSYYIGYLGKEEWITKYLRIPKDKTEKFKSKIRGKEGWIAFFCWLPFIGDIIAVVLGLLKRNYINVAVGMLIGKTLRYLIWGYLTVWALQ